MPRILLIIAAVIAVLLGMFFYMGKGKQKQSNPENSDTIVKENVKVLTSDMGEDELPEEVTENRLVFEKIQNTKKVMLLLQGVYRRQRMVLYGESFKWKNRIVPIFFIQSRRY